MGRIKIDKNVPIPGPQYSGGGRPKKYPLEKLDIGDSMFLEGDQYVRASIQRTAAHQSKVLDRKFVTRTLFEDGKKGVRVWRVE